MVQSIQDLGNLPKHLRLLYELLKGKGIDLLELEEANIRRVNFWQQGQKDAAGEPNVLDLAGIELAPSWEEGPRWPVVQPAEPIKLPANRATQTANKLSGWERAVVLPDMQIGFYRNLDGEIEPTHDENAIAIALAIIQDANPSQVVMLGDNLDLPEFSKYRLSPAFAGTTQASIDQASIMLASVRNAAPAADLVWIEGNHENRLKNYVLDNAKAAFGLRKAGDIEGAPDLSVPGLCRFDEYGVKYLPGYPSAQHWITPRLRAIHGSIVRKKSTASAVMDDARASTIYGHIHRVEYMERSGRDYDGTKIHMVASPGCLCRIDGAVPSTRGGIDLDGRPLLTVDENWQQGLAVVEYDPVSGAYAYEHVGIYQIGNVKRAVWRGKHYTVAV